MQDSGTSTAVPREGERVLEHCLTSMAPSKAAGKSFGVFGAGEFAFFSQVIHFQIASTKKIANPLEYTLAHYYH